MTGTRFPEEGEAPLHLQFAASNVAKSFFYIVLAIEFIFKLQLFHLIKKTFVLTRIDDVSYNWQTLLFIFKNI